MCPPEFISVITMRLIVKAKQTDRVIFDSIIEISVKTYIKLVYHFHEYPVSNIYKININLLTIINLNITLKSTNSLSYYNKGIVFTKI